MNTKNTDGLIKEFDVVADAISRVAIEGAVISVDPDVADHMGAFEDSALSEFDALDSRFDDVALGGK